MARESWSSIHVLCTNPSLNRSNPNSNPSLDDCTPTVNYASSDAHIPSDSSVIQHVTKGTKLDCPPPGPSGSRVALHQPLMVVCYLCGTKHRLEGLQHHHQVCAEMRELVLAQLDPSERDQYIRPPDVMIPSSDANLADVDAYNTIVQAVYDLSKGAFSGGYSFSPD